MAFQTRRVLESMHLSTGKLLRLCNRLMAAMICLGTIFSCMVIVGLQGFQNPEHVLQTQAFMFNYHEFSRVQQPAEKAQKSLTLHPLKREKTSPSVSQDIDILQDPNWDGMLAGASLGMSVGRNIPLIGFAVGPVLGALLGYRLDERV